MEAKETREVESLVVLESGCPTCLTRDPMEAPSRSPSYSLGARGPTMRGSPRSTTLIQNIFQRQLSGASTTNHCRSEGPHGDRPSRQRRPRQLEEVELPGRRGGDCGAQRLREELEREQRGEQGGRRQLHPGADQQGGRGAPSC